MRKELSRRRSRKERKQEKIGGRRLRRDGKNFWEDGRGIEKIIWKRDI